MDLKYLIGLDIGTSSVKGVLVSEDGTEWKTDKAEFTYTYRENGGVEIDAGGLHDRVQLPAQTAGESRAGGRNSPGHFGRIRERQPAAPR